MSASHPRLPQRQLGQFLVSALGLGAMPVSMGSEGAVDHDRGIATIHAALDAGITLIDTADIYAPSWDTMGHNEQLVAEALASWSGDRDQVVVATKGGITRGEGESWDRDSSAAYLRAAVEKSLTRLKVDSIDLYYWHRPDNSRPYAEGVEVLAGLRDEGVVREVGVSNANVEQLRIAEEVLGKGTLAAVQNEFSPRFNHTSSAEMRWCATHGAAFLPWSPLGGTSGGAREVGTRYPAIAEIAQDRGISPQQLVLAWELALGGHVIPIPGASRPESITDSAGAVTIELTPDEVERINGAVNLPR